MLLAPIWTPLLYCLSSSFAAACASLFVLNPLFETSLNFPLSLYRIRKRHFPFSCCLILAMIINTFLRHSRTLTRLTLYLESLLFFYNVISPSDISIWDKTSFVSIKFKQLSMLILNFASICSEKPYDMVKFFRTYWIPFQECMFVFQAKKIIIKLQLRFLPFLK